MTVPVSRTVVMLVERRVEHLGHCNVNNEAKTSSDDHCQTINMFRMENSLPCFINKPKS